MIFLHTKQVINASEVDEGALSHWAYWAIEQLSFQLSEEGPRADPLRYALFDLERLKRSWFDLEH